MNADPLDDQFNAALDRVNKLGEETRLLRNRLEVWAATQPQTIACKRHAHVIRAIEWNESSRESYYATKEAGADTFKLIYTTCEECAKDQAERDKGNWLKSCGVPQLLLHGSFLTFRAESAEDRQNIAEAKRFVAKAIGFLIMTGSLGDGKSLLAAAVMREFHGGLWITHNDLLLELRRGYNHPRAVDIIQRCQRAKLLVVDDFGLSMGGSDELPMLQSIWDYRYGEKKPSVLTSNLTLEAIYEAVGERLADRMKQALFKHLQFTGPSSRPAERQSYFAEQ